jgi:hypothetical protein
LHGTVVNSAAISWTEDSPDLVLALKSGSCARTWATHNERQHSRTAIVLPVVIGRFDTVEAIVHT